MSFLQPMLLAALPLLALPVVIHLINQRRYQSIRWAAMIFLLAANRMSRGYARLRQWLILACRMLAVAGLVFVISRPLAGGWLGLTAGGRPDTTIIMLDRSPSMRQSGAGVGGTKLETGRRQLVQALTTLDSARWVAIESTTNTVRELETIDSLLNSPSAEPTSATTDILAMLQTAHDYIRDNKCGETEIWICSDIRENDWNAEGGQWSTIREAFLKFSQRVRFHLLAYPQTAAGNVSVQVTNVRRQKTGDGAELLVSLRLAREADDDSKQSIPVQFEIEGARSEVAVEMSGPGFELKDHRIPLERSHERGWGKVSIPADSNLADNNFWFVFDEPVPRRSIIVADEPQNAGPLQLAASIPPDPALQCTAEVIDVDQLGSVEWETVSLLLWQAQLPEGTAAQLVQAFIDRGGFAIFFPPRAPGDGVVFGTRWKSWSDETQDITVENWRGDQDLLAHTQSGTALPVGQLQIRRYCGLAGEFTPLATLKGGAPLLARVTTNRGGTYFCATNPAVGESSLATEGVVLYVLVQRALAGGAAALGNTRQLVAGDPADHDPSKWKRLAGSDEAASTDYPLHSGVYLSGDRLLAVNRASAEDSARVLPDQRVAGLFRGLDFKRVDDRAGSISSLIQEIWRLFLVAMMLAMLVEAALCLPKMVRPAGSTS
jgi:Aerotolerance regulator N-terminal